MYQDVLPTVLYQTYMVLTFVSMRMCLVVGKTKEDRCLGADLRSCNAAGASGDGKGGADMSLASAGASFADEHLHRGAEPNL